MQVVRTAQLEAVQQQADIESGWQACGRLTTPRHGAAHWPADWPADCRETAEAKWAKCRQMHRPDRPATESTTRGGTPPCYSYEQEPPIRFRVHVTHSPRALSYDGSVKGWASVARAATSMTAPRLRGNNSLTMMGFHSS